MIFLFLLVILSPYLLAANILIIEMIVISNLQKMTNTEMIISNRIVHLEKHMG